MKKTKRMRIIIDTDMGNDDIMAIAMLFSSTDVDVRAIIVTNGVASIPYGVKNLTKVLAFINKSVPIYKGSNTTISKTNAVFPKRDVLRAERLTLLKNLKFPKIPIKQAPSFKKLPELFQSEETYTLIALGPLTNIARLYTQYGNSFTKKIDQIVMMGGGIQKGNVAPFMEAEYNIWLDPKAADIVMGLDIPITMVGIDATSYVPVTNGFSQIVQKTKPKTAYGKLIKEIIINNDKDIDAFYDPLATSIFIDKSIVTGSKKESIRVVLKGNKRGKTICADNRRKNTRVITKVDSVRFYEFVLSLLV